MQCSASSKHSMSTRADELTNNAPDMEATPANMETAPTCEEITPESRSWKSDTGIVTGNQ